MEAVEVPQYFLCPISLQIMKDPVTTTTGMTYDRESIEQWLANGRSSVCPVTNQELPTDSGLTPNHTLRRLIQAWCTLNSSSGVIRIPTPKAPLDKAHVAKLLRDLSLPSAVSDSLKKFVSLASESERNRQCMADAGAAKTMIPLTVKWFREGKMDWVEKGIEILSFFQLPDEELQLVVIDNYDFVDTLTWVLRKNSTSNHNANTHAVLVLKSVVHVLHPHLLERLNLQFFEGIVQVLREKISRKAIKAALHILMEACPCGRNRMKIVEAGATFELIELELTNPERSVTELVLGILDQLCKCADGRAKFLEHSAGIAVVSARILRVSAVAGEHAVRILSSVCKFSATNEVVNEMLRVGAVSKLSIVLQADCPYSTKEKARAVLKMHSKLWSGSPCAAVYLLTRYP